MSDDGFAEIAMQDPADVDPVLHDHGPVQPIFLEQGGMPRGVDAALASQCFNRVARYQADQEKGNERHSQKGRDDQTQTGEEEA